MVVPKFTAASPDEFVLRGCQIREMKDAPAAPPKREKARWSSPAAFFAVNADVTACLVRFQKPDSVERK